MDQPVHHFSELFEQLGLRSYMHMGAYAAGHGLNNAGVLSGDDMTPEAAYTKLVHVLAQPISLEDQRRRFLTTLVGER